jgi:hypothetical protein
MNFHLRQRRLSGFIMLRLGIVILISLANYVIYAQEDLGVLQDRGNTWLQFRNADNSFYQYLADQAYVLLEKRAESINGLSSLSEVENKQQMIRKAFMDVVGPFPEKAPLNAKVLRVIKKDGYSIEHILIESQPGFFVTSMLFIPDGLKGKAPVVIYCCGHSDNGYRDPVYQHILINLVKKRFIAFVFDPVGQGERLEYFDPTTGKSIVGGATSEHSYPGAQAFITGSSQARYMIWDGIRAVDYVLSRKEVDPARIGITGRSGGGTQSAYIAAMDERIYAAAPENYTTNFTRIFQSKGPSDAEQNLFNGIARGLDHADYFLARAPKPALMITTTRDHFSIQGARETAKEVSRIYRIYGKEENFSMVEDDAPHQSTKKNREAMYAFFQKHLNNPGNPDDVEYELLSSEEVQVTKTGQVSTSLGGETVFSLNRKETEKLAGALEVSRSDIDRHLSEVLSSARRLSGYHEPAKVNEPAFTGRFQRDGYVIEKYFVKGEGNYIIPYLLFKPEKPNNKALLYIHPSGKAKEAPAGGEIEWFVRNGFTVMAPDMLGVGEVGTGDSTNVLRKEWYASILIGRSVTGIRAGDVVRLTRVLGKSNEISDIYALAKEEMAPVLLHAAAFEPTISRIALIKPYSSSLSIVMNRFYDSRYISSTVPGMLAAYDLPDLAASLAPRKLLIINATDGEGKTLTAESIKNDLNIIQTVFHSRNADNQLNITFLRDSKKPYDSYLGWIK